MFAYCENPDCDYDTGDCPSGVKCTKWLIDKIKADGGKCRKKDQTKCTVNDYSCPKCGKKTLTVD